MKKMMMGMALAMFVAGAANAQDAPRKTMQDRTEMRTETMVKELGLSEEQAAKVKDLNERYGAKKEAMREQSKSEMAVKNEKHEALEKEFAAELKGVLTPEQFEKWEARQKEMTEKRMERRDQMKKEGMQMRKQEAPAKKEMREKAQ